MRTPTSSISGMLATLRLLGVVSLNRQLAWLATCSFFSGVAQASLLVLVSEFAVNSTQGKTHLQVHGHSVSIADAIFLSAMLLLVFLVAGIAGALISSSMASKALSASRNSMIDSFFHASWPVQSQERLGHIQQLLTVNCENVGNIVQGMAAGLQALLMVAALLIAAFLVNPITAAIVLVLGILLSTALRPFNRWTRRASVNLSENSHTMATLVTEYTRLTREFRVFGVEREAVAYLERSSEIAATTYRKMKLLLQASPVVYQTLALAFIVGALALVSGHTKGNLGPIAAVLILTIRSMYYGSVIQSTSQQLRSFGGFLDTIRLDLEHFRHNQYELGDEAVPTSFDIRVQDVSFSYDHRKPVLEQISFLVPGGEILGIVGRSGSGKTTLSQILLGMRQPAEGLVLVGDVSATGIVKKDGESPVALVTQDPVLLQGSIAFNISFFRTLTPERIESASRAAHLHEDVMAMPDLYETAVGEGGTALSVGQRQRLAIARALAGSPRLLVLDEPTSALDGRSESLIRQTLKELHGRVTIVVISHRLGTVEDCDLLLVLNEGRVADFGPSGEVLTRTAFRQVAESATGDGVPREPV
jgi:ABC-type multidrug transport system fused ATPase/permease subunit